MMEKLGSILQCPDCNRVIHSKNPGFNHWQCTCRDIVYQNDQGELKSSLRHSIQSSNDIIQPGSIGCWNGQSFTVCGRFRLWGIENVFNYWTIEMKDGSLNILGEAYGLYAFYERIDFKEIVLFGKLNALQNNKSTWLGNTEYDFIRKNEISFWDAEGDCYKPKEHLKRTFELMTADRKFIEIFELEDESFEMYSVTYTSFESLKLNKLRQQFGQGKSFRCASCGVETSLRLYPYTQSWSCISCNVANSVFNGGSRKETNVSTLKVGNIFALDTVLQLKGIDYKVIGFAVKEDSKEEYQWREYTLHNPSVGFAFLNESDGHWSLVKEIGDSPCIDMAKLTSFNFADKSFQLFNKYGFKIVYAQGEFAGNIFNDSFKLYAKDFIAPPYLLCFEQGDREHSTWFLGEHVSRAELKKQTKEYLPLAIGVGPVEPKAMVDRAILIKCTVVVFLLLFGIHYLIGMGQKQKILLDEQFVLVDSIGQQTFISNVFELRKWKSNLEFQINAPVDNSWFELEATLVNKASGDEYSLQQGVEQYHGVTDGESWSEGGTQETVYLSSIPEGEYFLKLTAIHDVYSYITGSRLNSFSLRVTNDVPMTRNFWLIIIVVLIWPVYKIYTINYYERKRWENSSFNPYPPS